MEGWGGDSRFNDSSFYGDYSVVLHTLSRTTFFSAKAVNPTQQRIRFRICLQIGFCKTTCGRKSELREARDQADASPIPLSLYLPPSFLRVPGPRLLKLIATIKNVYCSTSEKGDDDDMTPTPGGRGRLRLQRPYTEVPAASTGGEGRKGRSLARGVDVCVRGNELSE